MSKRVSNRKGAKSKNKTKHRHRELAWMNRMENQGSRLTRLDLLRQLRAVFQ